MRIGSKWVQSFDETLSAAIVEGVANPRGNDALSQSAHCSTGHNHRVFLLHASLVKGISSRSLAEMTCGTFGESRADFRSRRRSNRAPLEGGVSAIWNILPKRPCCDALFRFLLQTNVHETLSEGYLVKNTNAPGRIC